MFGREFTNDMRLGGNICIVSANLRGCWESFWVMVWISFRRLSGICVSTFFCLHPKTALVCCGSSFTTLRIVVLLSVFLRALQCSWRRSFLPALF